VWVYIYLKLPTPLRLTVARACPPGVVHRCDPQRATPIHFIRARRATAKRRRIDAQGGGGAALVAAVLVPVLPLRAAHHATRAAAARRARGGLARGG